MELDKDTKELMQLIDEEYQIGYKILCEKLGKEKLDLLYATLTEASNIAIDEQFDSYADIHNIHLKRLYKH